MSKKEAQFFRAMFMSDPTWPQVTCPLCDERLGEVAVPHLINVFFGRGVPEDSTSGQGLVLQYECEDGHRWEVRFVDHSGGTWFEGLKGWHYEP